MDRTAAAGTWGRVEWGVDARGRLPARDAFCALDEGKRSKILPLFRLLAETGKIQNREKFRLLGERAKGEAKRYWEFKSYQDRFLGNFKPGGRFVITAYTLKKTDKLSPEDIDRTVRVMHENDTWEHQESQQQKQGAQTTPTKKQS